jgi:transmembrane sensor
MLLDRAAPRSDAPAVSTAMRVISTAAGQRADIRLSDGTRVSLGVDSRLRVAPDFGERSRDLYLDGTAYFDVVHDSTRPFRVHTATAVAQDVGTRFVVSAYRESGSTEVVVAAGSVTLRAPHDSSTRAVQLGAGNLARIGGRNAPVVVRAVDPSQYLAWMDGRLVFHDTPLSDVVTELHRWYDEDVRIGDSTLAELPLTASFDAASLRETLKVITTVLPLRAVRRDGVVTLYRR